MSATTEAQASMAPAAHSYSIDKVRRSLVHFVLGKGMGMVLGLGLMLLLVRALSLADYGFFLVSQAVLEIVGQFSSLGLMSIAQRYLPELLTHREGRSLLALARFLCISRILTLLAAAALCYALAPSIITLIDLPDFLLPFRLFLLVVVLESFARFLEVIFDSLLMQGVSQVALLLRGASRLSAMSWLFLSSGQTVALETWIAIDAAAALLGCLWSVIALWRFLATTASEVPGSPPHLDLKRHSAYSLPNYVAGVLYTASSAHAVRLVAARVLGAVEFASFGFASAFSAMLQRYLPLFLLIGMIRPLFVAARQRPDYALRLPEMANLVFKLNAFALAPAIAFVAVAGVPLASLLTGGRYPEAGGYLLAFMVLLPVQALRGVVGLTAQAMESALAPLVGTLLGLFGLFAGIGLSTAFGGYGLCAGLIVSELVFAGWVLLSLRKAGLTLVAARSGFARLSLATLAAALAAWAYHNTLSQGSLLDLIAIATISLAVNLGVAFFLKPFTDEERATINRILKIRIFVW